MKVILIYNCLYFNLSEEWEERFLIYNQISNNFAVSESNDSSDTEDEYAGIDQEFNEDLIREKEIALNHQLQNTKNII